MKLDAGETLVIATHNPGKLPELRDMFSPLGLILKSAGELGLPEPEETGLTFEENALLKARAAAKASGLTAVADDSGLCVHALDNAPGIYTARYAKENGGYSKGMKRLGEDLRNKGSCDSTAHFVCVLALASPDGEELTFRGEVNGHLEFPERGTNGFGFDPIFVMEGMDQTYGEIPQLLKDKINHRAQAFEKLVAGLRLKAGH